MGKSGHEQRMKHNHRKNKSTNKRAFIDAKEEKRVFEKRDDRSNDDRHLYTYWKLYNMFPSTYYKKELESEGILKEPLGVLLTIKARVTKWVTK